MIPARHRARPPGQDDLLLHLVGLVGLVGLVKPGVLTDGAVLARRRADFFPSAAGRPATSPRLVAGLLCLQHAFRLSDEAVVARLGWKIPATGT